MANSTKTPADGGIAPEDTLSLLTEGLVHYGIRTTVEQVEKIRGFVQELGKWNRQMNLVGLKGAEEVIVQLIYDAFFLHRRLGTRSPVLDLGSGSGVVAIPLSILDEDRVILSVDKSLKKVQFQRHVKRVLRLEGLRIFHTRIEDLPPLDAQALVAKAFGAPADVLAKGQKHLREGGYAFVVTGKGKEATGYAGFALEEAVAYSLPKRDKGYQLFVYKKIS